MAKKAKSRFPKYPSLAYDHGALMAAKMELHTWKGNKSICLYCRAQAKSQAEIKHHPECPVPEDER